MLLSMVISARAEDFSNKIKYDFYLRQARDHTVRPSLREAYYDSLLTFGNDIGLALEKGKVLEEMGQYLKARDLYREYEYKLPKDSLSMYLNMTLHRASSEFFTGDYKEAIKRCYEVTSAEKPDSLLYYDTEANRLLAHLFSDYDDRLLSERYMQRAESALGRFIRSDAPQWTKDVAQGKMYYTYSSLAIDNMDYSLAFDNIKKAQKILHDYWPDAFTSINIGLIYQLQGELDMAEKFYRDVLTVADYHPDFILALLNCVEIHIEKGDTAGAQELLRQHEEYLPFLNGTPWENNINMTRFDYALATGNTAEALKSLRKAYEFTDSVGRRQTRLYINELARQYERSSLNSFSEDTAMSERRWKNVTKWMIFIMVMAISIIIWLFIKLYRQSDRLKVTAADVSRYKRIVDEKDSISEESLNKRNRELMAMSMHMTRLNEALNKIQEYSGNQTLQRNELASKIKTELKDLASQEHVWQMFKVYFEEVNQSFFDTLYKICPELTNAEIRMCALIRAGMSSKEIATATNRSVRTVDCIKYNLRKKLGIEEGTDVYIRRLSAQSSHI